MKNIFQILIIIQIAIATMIIIMKSCNYIDGYTALVLNIGITGIFICLHSMGFKCKL